MRALVSYFLRKNFQAEIINISAAHFFFPRLFVGVRPHFPLFLPLFHDSLLLFVVSSRVFPSFRSGKRKQIDPESGKWAEKKKGQLIPCIAVVYGKYGRAKRLQVLTFPPGNLVGLLCFED